MSNQEMEVIQCEPDISNMEKRSPHVVLKKDPNLDKIAAKVLSVSESDSRQRTPRQVCLLKCCLVLSDEA